MFSPPSAASACTPRAVASAPSGLAEPSIGVLLVNLGTPEAPDPPAIRRYLGEFLSDPRVVELPALLWQPILRGLILRCLGKLVARYASIWRPDGSPLLVYSRAQAQALQARLSERGLPVRVALAMRYGQPALDAVYAELREQCERILVLPLYPQYAASTTASVVDKVSSLTARLRNQPELRFIKRFHLEAGYIDALAARIHARWQAEGEPERLVMSFHSLPQRCIERGDPYARDCQQSAQALAARLGLPPERWLLTFQSRFGRARWLEPYTEASLRELARAGVRRVDVICPGFVADCVETLQEIDQECRAAFLAAGGEQFRYIAALNDSPHWVAALEALVARHVQAWV